MPIRLDPAPIRCFGHAINDPLGQLFNIWPGCRRPAPTLFFLDRHLGHPQGTGLNSVDDVFDVARFNYDCWPVGLKAILLTNIFFDPHSPRIRYWTEKKNAAVILDYNVSCHVISDLKDRRWFEEFALLRLIVRLRTWHRFPRGYGCRSADFAESLDD
jgi:hypothetical protein